MERGVYANRGPGRREISRVDANGRAYAGSQRQIQTYVNDLTELLNRAVAESLRLDFDSIDVDWVSPIQAESYAEYRDDAFRRCLGLASHIPLLRDFWPQRGPSWDALASLRQQGNTTYLLIEAKSHVPEIYGNGCGAGERSRMTIERALAETKTWLDVDPDANWMGPLYQSANRYSYLYFLREIAKVDAYLINLYFTDDLRSPTSRATWEPAIRKVNRELGLKRSVPFSETVFLAARK